jgi:hypothetical protein
MYIYIYIYVYIYVYIGVTYGPPEQMLTTARVFLNAWDGGFDNAEADDKSVHVRNIPLSSLTTEATKDMAEFYNACGHFSRLLGQHTSLVTQVDVIEFGSKHAVKVAFNATKKATGAKEVRHINDRVTLILPLNNTCICISPNDKISSK